MKLTIWGREQETYALLWQLINFNQGQSLLPKICEHPHHLDMHLGKLVQLCLLYLTLEFGLIRVFGELCSILVCLWLLQYKL
jgi:hypothetical protein